MIYYLCPDYDVPSWGIGMIYYHVYFLQKNNIEAAIVHKEKGFTLSWLSLKVPIHYQSQGWKPVASDITVIPEFFIEDEAVKKLKCRKILFVQNSFILFERIKQLSSLNNNGFEAVFYYMPHLKKILTTYFDQAIYETPAFIAEYYYKKENELHTRQKNIIIYPKSNSRDYAIIDKLLKDKFETNLLKKFFNSSKHKWKLITMSGYSHKEVAGIMKDAAFFININTYEAFNSSVPEAMAAGCINLTYDAFGPADFLEDKKNAFVFNNNHVFDLFDTLFYHTENYDDSLVQKQLSAIREQAYLTANGYTMQLAETAIVKIARQLLGQ